MMVAVGGRFQQVAMLQTLSGCQTSVWIVLEKTTDAIYQGQGYATREQSSYVLWWHLE
jgi:sulfur transfer protein SufE